MEIEEKLSLAVRQGSGLMSLLPNLSAKERRVVRVRISDGHHPLSWREVGKECGMSHEHARLMYYGVLLRIAS